MVEHLLQLDDEVVSFVVKRTLSVVLSTEHSSRLSLLRNGVPSTSSAISRSAKKHEVSRKGQTESVKGARRDIHFFPTS